MRRAFLNDQEFLERIGISGAANEWAAIKKYVSGLPPESAFVFLRVLGENLPIGADVEAAINDTGDVWGHIVAGAALIVRATRTRGMGTADSVKEENWQSYFAYRERAEQLLRFIVTHHPKNGQAVAWLMTAAVDSDDAAKAEASDFLLASENVPISGYSKLLSANTRKWGGSHEAMWEIARKCAEVRHPWSSALIAKAHYEQWLYLALMDERPAAEYEAAGYFQNEMIREEIRNISEAINTAQSDDPYEAVFAHDVLAAVFSEAGIRKSSAQHLRRVGKFGDPALLTGGPWWRRTLVRMVKGLPPW